MKAAPLKEIKSVLKEKSQAELLELCLRITKYKVENKELLSYLLFDASDETDFVKRTKEHIDSMFDEMNTSTIYFTKKGVRKVLRHTKKYIKYSKRKDTEVELLMHYCEILSQQRYFKNSVIRGIFDREIVRIQKAIATLHEDLQFDYTEQLKELGLI